MSRADAKGTVQNMKDHNSSEKNKDTTRTQRPGSVKRPYATPRIEVMCDVRAIVLSPTPGIFESGPGSGFETKTGRRG